MCVPALCFPHRCHHSCPGWKMARAHQHLHLTVTVGRNVTNGLAQHFTYTDRLNITMCGFFSFQPTTSFKMKGIGHFGLYGARLSLFFHGKKSASHIPVACTKDLPCAKQNPGCLLDYILQETVDVLLMVLTENDA